MSLADVHQASPGGTPSHPRTAGGRSCMTSVLTTLHVLRVCKDHAHVGAAYPFPHTREGPAPT